MFTPALCSFHVSVTQGFLSSRKGVLPCGMGLVTAWGNRYEIPNRPTKDTHGRGQFGVSVRAVAVLKHCSLEGVNEQTLYNFDPNFSPAVTMGKGNGGEVVVD